MNLKSSPPVTLLAALSLYAVRRHSSTLSLGGRGFSRHINPRRQAISAALPHPQQVVFPAAPAPEKPVSIHPSRLANHQIKWDTAPLDSSCNSLKTNGDRPKQVGHSSRPPIPPSRRPSASSLRLCLLLQQSVTRFRRLARITQITSHQSRIAAPGRHKVPSQVRVTR